MDLKVIVPDVGNPPPIQFRYNMVTSLACKVPLLATAIQHLQTDGHSDIIPLDGSEVDKDIARSLLLPTKWAAELVDLHLLPGHFLEFVVKKIERWNDADKATARFAIDWALAACSPSSLSTSNSKSHLGIELGDFDLRTDGFDEWAEARLLQTLGATAVAAAVGNTTQPIIVNLPNLPQPSLSQMDMAYNRGAEAHKRNTETSVATGTKYTAKQMTHLLAFCGLTPGEKDLLPDIWTSLQDVKSWHDASTELTKWFAEESSLGEIPVQFHKELVEDIRKYMFSFGPAPLAATAHRGITPLAFTLLSVSEDNQLREDQDAYDGATSLTPAMLKAARRKCPSPPFEFDKFERLLIRYVLSGRRLFTVHCPHFISCNFLRQDLMLVYRRNLGSLLRNTLVGLMWDIIADSAQFFSTYTSSADFNATPQRNMPLSFMGTRRSLLSMNQHSAPLDTPSCWLVPVQLPGGPHYPGLGKTRQQQEGERHTQGNGGGGGSMGGDTGGGGDAGFNGGGDEGGKHKSGENQERNMDMHPILKILMEPVHAQNIPFRINALCKLAGMTDMRKLPQCNNNCFRWLLGLCEGRDNNKGRCKARPENVHAGSGVIPDDYALQLSKLLQPSVDKLVAEFEPAPNAKRQRT